ncbi:protein of unknown function [Candidatus Nitrosocosmicus franklandus]|uniref:Uncharacterized protein n=1 Tax=Candidatus Nitrosocosmicus franklandianus TaxID=1798806 RepID=A0A484I7C2_9ARCH|nr:protein of unknown function [Candidatus Nitrosocosmicus franklandus]
MAIVNLFFKSLVMSDNIFYILLFLIGNKSRIYFVRIMSRIKRGLNNSWLFFSFLTTLILLNS